MKWHGHSATNFVYESIIGALTPLALLWGEIRRGGNFQDSIMEPKGKKTGSDMIKKTGQQQRVTVPSPKGPIGIVDSYWEMADPNPNIYELFMQFDALFFESVLNNRGVSVQWSPRMTLCAGVCKYERRGRFCTVHLSTPLLKLRPRKDLIETLLHEMIHALLFVTENNQDRDGHGPNFQSHMNRINRTAGTNITIYHSFHNEVKEYRQHWWRCKGACRNKSPFFGYVKRAMNRAPSHNDLWWAEHQKTCGGEFEKVKEPENYKKKETGKKRVQDGNKGKGKASSKSPQVSTDVAKGTGKQALPDVTLVNGVIRRSDDTIGSSSNSRKETILFPGKGVVLGYVPAASIKTDGPIAASELSQSNGSVCAKGKLHSTPVLPVPGSATNDARLPAVTKAGSKRPAESDIRNFLSSSNDKKIRQQDPISATSSSVLDENQPCSSKDILGGSFRFKSNKGIPGSVKSEVTNPSLCGSSSQPRTAETSPGPDVVDLTADSPGPLPTPALCVCPVCGLECSQKTINQHLDECLAM